MSIAASTSAQSEPLTPEIDQLAITTLRFLAADAVQSANSGHPGLPLGAAPAAWVLWSRHLRHDPTDPRWPDRDRFVLSAGHGSALLYALLHVFGYDLPASELAQFRQLGSRTPGHPEYGLTAGVETTTGPLGQGLANAVGMALAERMLAARCNNEVHESVVDHRTWVLAGDGDLMEGISHEAASLAGRLGLGRLTVIFDDNNITIDGTADLSCRDDALARFAAYGWQTISVEDGNDVAAIDQALTRARENVSTPTFIKLRTTIGCGAPGLEGTSKVHGSPLGAEALAAMRTNFDWPPAAFHVPEAVRAATSALAGQAAQVREQWERDHADWIADHPQLAADFPLGRVPGPPETDILTPLTADIATERIATRQASGMALNALAPHYPALVGGSADLAGSTNTGIVGGDVKTGNYGGRTIHFGIREHAMAAVMNGMSVHGGLRPFGSTFLVFADYLRPALRMSALMRQPVIYVFTHDSIYVGEDGPTHQPIEHIESLRLIPGLTVLRPADAAETAQAWDIASRNLAGPTALILSRQSLPTLGDGACGNISTHGFRVVRNRPDAVDVVLAASGSEVSLAVEAADLLADRDIHASVLSVMWRERLHETLLRDPKVLPDLPVVWIEAGIPTGWRAVARDRDAVVGIARFGESGPGPQVAAHLGLTASAIAEAAFSCLDSASAGKQEPAIDC
ncbi:transketolase [Mycolicibacterium brisbanense]|uniref:Transketolase n=1 Tax=Mycolicibacterium brisbanense TaxID=146020 RepID=A0A100VV00_9MYCO|nr:transketolase [Mycolicibacterium brisbanense]MCV7156225.1 transketolase [Mycolicibacterium brisbanense]GAS86384.1 transketolase [Mycolicibacterium brisbanense]